MTLLDRHVEFLVALRRAGLAVSVAEDIDAATALAAVDVLDREELRAAYAAALVKRRQHRPAFDTLFDLYFPATSQSPSASQEELSPQRERDVGEGARSATEPGARERIRERLLEELGAEDDAGLAALARDAVDALGAVTGGAADVQSWSRYLTLTRTSPQTLLAAFLAARLEDGERGGLAERTARARFAARVSRFEQFVDTEVQRRVAAQRGVERVARSAVRPAADRLDLLHATDAELAAIRREIQPLARRLASRLTITHRHGRRGKLDFRRTIRASLSSGGVPVQPRFRPRHPRRTDLVILCDVSDSVSPFARFTLLLVFALREQFTRLRVFAFVDELDEVTRFFKPGGDLAAAIDRIDREARVRGWSGRTDYGRAFRLFNQRHADAVTPRTTLLVLGDARSNYGDPAPEVLGSIARRARQAHWLNPERRGNWDTGDSCAGRLGQIVPMTECRNLAQLGEFVSALA